MRAKTKLEKKIYKYRNRLGEITEKQKEFCKGKVESFVTFRHKSHVCIDCKHKWKDNMTNTQIVGGITCPNCQKDLVLREFTGYDEVERYMTILTVSYGYQVIRTIRVGTYIHAKDKPSYSAVEVAQTWMGPDGKSLKLRKNTGMYGTGWSWGSALEVRSNPYGYGNNYDRTSGIVPHYYYRIQKVLPILKHRGFTTDNHHISPVFLAQALLSDNYAETLIKVKQMELLDYYIYNPTRVQEHLPHYRIALRHSYKVEDAKSWIDYIEMLEELKMDARNIQYLLPKDFKEAHARILKIVKRKRDEEQKIADEEARIEKERLDALDKKFFAKRKKLLKGFIIKKGNIEVVPFMTPKQVQRESDLLDHCAFDRKYHLKKKTVLLSARVNGKVMETVDFSLDQGKVNQCRGYDNEPTKYNRAIIGIVNKNANKLIKQLSA